MRKVVVLRERVFAELGEAAARPVTRVAALAVVANPFAGRLAANLEPLWLLGAELGEGLMPELAALLGAPAVSYGKGAIVGVNGEAEHGGACVHPMLGRPMRAAVGGGAAVVPSNAKMAAAAAGAALDLPLGHEDDPRSFAHFDTMTVVVPDAPRPDEIVVAPALADGAGPATATAAGR